MKKLQFLVPQYAEGDEVVKPLLDSIAVQQCIDFADIGVIICNDGSDVRLSDGLLESYPFDVEYHIEAHEGIAATRNKALDRATAEYVMFCDDDDCFINSLGVYLYLNEIEKFHADVIVAPFVEETRNEKGGYAFYTHDEHDLVFVHSKAFRRDYLVRNKLRFNGDIKYHEDVYFVSLVCNIAPVVRSLKNAVYMWHYRAESTSHQPLFVFNTYPELLKSRTAMIQEFRRRGREELSIVYAAMMFYDAWFSYDTPAWKSNAEQAQINEKALKSFFVEFRRYFDRADKKTREIVIAKSEERAYVDGFKAHSISIYDFINKILSA